jgi:hypothetical protein
VGRARPPRAPKPVHPAAMLRPALPDHPFTTADAHAWGLSGEDLRLRVKDGRLRRLFTGVYVRSGLEDTTLLRAQAARLVMSEHSVLCDRTAAWLHDVDVYRYAELDGVPELESFVLRGHRPTDRADCHGRTRDLLAEDWTWVGGVPVTTPLRTAVDLACLLSRRDALAALDAFARDHAVTVGEMNRLLLRYRRRGASSRPASWCSSRTDGPSRAASPGPGWRSSTTDSRRRRRSTGSRSTGVRRTASTWPGRGRGWSWSTTGRSSTRRRASASATRSVVSGCGAGGGT